MIDLRSDTVTQPSQAMRRAMAEATVGDDGFGEDPTVRLLEAESAAAMGKEAALFFPSGTMANQAALHLHGRPGYEVMCEAQSHIVVHEMGAMAALNGMQPLPISSRGGRLDPQVLKQVLSARGDYQPPVALLAVENTHNMAGGRVSGLEELAALLELAEEFGLPTHLDGARIFNAACALDLPVSRVAEGFDSVMFCLTKGLGAPVGSMLCGGRSFIKRARRVRKMFGGGGHQIGVLAAAGLVALRDGPARLAEDHRLARRLADGLTNLPGIDLDPSAVVTNIVIFEVQSGEGTTPASDSKDAPASQFCDRLETIGVRAVPLSSRQVRMVTHRDLSSQDIDQAVSGMRSMHS
ncbi:MAG: aminotransferase class I/II-fold pyridoxal phosphate-dependent enzyme [Deltaproteobacteria bacterium]|nr:aminotransferase class I/II-fold pyridoxal phosphate-dependent enzyme [Deltaproteobacteria bacterium]